MDLIAFTLIAVLGFFLGREVPADRVILLPDADGKVGAVFVKTQQGEQLLNTAYGSVSVSAQGAIAAGNEEAKVTRERYAPALVALPARPVSFTVFFVSGSDTQLSAESVPVIQQMKDALAARPAAQRHACRRLHPNRGRARSPMAQPAHPPADLTDDRVMEAVQVMQMRLRRAPHAAELAQYLAADEAVVYAHLNSLHRRRYLEPVVATQAPLDQQLRWRKWRGPQR